MNDSLVDLIKSRGYWRINFQPTGAPAELSLKDCEELIAKNHVHLRGWNYPFYGHGSADNHGVENHNTFCQGWIDSGEFKEFWRMYKSGQFLHYSVVHEDWMTPETRDARFHSLELEPGKYLNFVGSLTYFVTEIIEFSSRLHRSGLYKDGVTLSISLNNTKGRELNTFEGFRHLSFPKVTQAEIIEFKKSYTPQELDLPAKDIAVEPILHFFKLFNFGDVSVDQVIKKDQDSLYDGKFF